MRKILWIILPALLFGVMVANLSASFYFIFLFKQSTLTEFILATHFILFILILVAGVLFLREKQRYTQLVKEKHSIEMNWHEQHNHFESVFNYTNNGIALLNLDGHFFRVNKSLSELFDYHLEDMLKMNFYDLIHSNDKDHMSMHIQQLINQKINFYQSEQQCFRKNGDILWIMSTVSLIRDNQDQPKHFLVQAQDITRQKKTEERLQHMAYHDALTGLANRHKLEQFINHMLASARRRQQNFALLFLDLDRFKNINDTIGHEAGDILLQVIAERLRNAVRNTDMVARLGGDEFVLLITDMRKTESAALIAQKIMGSVLQVIMIKGQEIYTTTSIGISLYPYDGQDMQTLMKNADLALYRAKEHGRNNYQFYTLEMTSKAQEKLALQNALGHALVKNEFVLNYQPKMDIQTHKITGIEALLRWKNKEYGMITPDEIISLAEETGLIIPVSDWILKTACQQLKIWHDMGYDTLTMAVNCSGKQFKQATFVDDILSTISQIGLLPQSLEIEITEHIIMQDPENILRALYAFKDLGIQIVIDDFGTGYWSLSHLRRLSVDKIKIDKTFIKQLTFDETSKAITKAIIAMTNKLGIKSVAEGVETQEQYEFLAKEGCAEIQGYYLTQPLQNDEMTHFLKCPIFAGKALLPAE